MAIAGPAGGARSQRSVTVSPWNRDHGGALNTAATLPSSRAWSSGKCERLNHLIWKFESTSNSRFTLLHTIVAESRAEHVLDPCRRPDRGPNNHPMDRTSS